MSSGTLSMSFWGIREHQIQLRRPLLLSFLCPVKRGLLGSENTFLTYGNQKLSKHGSSVF
jgi:hypothetical protein